MTSWSTSSCTQPIIAVRSLLTCGPRDLRLPTRTLFTPFGKDWWNSRSNDTNVQSHTFSCSSILRGPAGFGSCQFSSWSMEHGALGRFDHCDSRRDPPFRGAISIGEVFFSYTAGPRTGDSRHLLQNSKSNLCFQYVVRDRPIAGPSNSSRTCICPHIDRCPAFTRP
jgi:hypothetical protein